jgi:hypothetical protein
VSDYDDRSGGWPWIAAGGTFHRYGSDSQKPFAIVIVAGLISRFSFGFFVNPVL